METLQLEQLRKELDEVIEKQKSISAGLALLNAKENKEKTTIAIDFGRVRAMGQAYPIHGHFMESKQGKDAYLRLLVFTALLLRPYSVNFEKGMSFIEKIRRALKGENPEDLLSRVMQEGADSLFTDAATVMSVNGNQAFTMDTILLYTEMEVSGMEAMKKISSFYLIMGVGERLLDEALEAVKLIQSGNREAYEEAAEKWKALIPAVPAPYIGLEKEYGLDGKSSLTAYYLTWPIKREAFDEEIYKKNNRDFFSVLMTDLMTDDAREEFKGAPQFAPKLVLVLNVGEGDTVAKGQTLFTIHGVDSEISRESIADEVGLYFREQRGYRGFYRSEGFLDYIPRKCFRDGRTDLSPVIRFLKDHAHDEVYEVIEVKASGEGIVAFNPKFEEVFANITVPKKDEYVHFSQSDFEIDPHLNALLHGGEQKLEYGDIFISGNKMNPTNCGINYICKVRPV